MKIFVRCKKCYKSVKIKGVYKYGSEEIIRKFREEKQSLTCTSCNNEYKYETRDLRANQDPVLLLVFSLVTLIMSSIILVYMVKNFWDRSFYSYLIIPSSFVIPWMVYFTFFKGEQISIKEFNFNVR